MKLHERLADLKSRVGDLHSDFAVQCKILPELEVIGRLTFPLHTHAYRGTYKKLLDLKYALQELTEVAEGEALSKLAEPRFGSKLPAIVQLGDLIKEAGLTLTFDQERNITLPCIFCGEKDKPRHLVQVLYVPADRTARRPICARCDEEGRRVVKT